MREVANVSPHLSSLQRSTPMETGQEAAIADIHAEERQRRRDAVLHGLAVARARRRRRVVSRFA